MSNKPLHEWTETDLKAVAYDELSKLDQIKRNISLIQEELSRRAKNRVEGSTPRQEQGPVPVEGQ